MRPETLPSPHLTKDPLRHPLASTAPMPKIKLPIATARSENGGRYAGILIAPMCPRAW